LTQLAFAGYGWLDPPSGALKETEQDVRRDLEEHGGGLARRDAQALGGLRFERRHGYLHVRRLAVDPAHQRQGIGTALMEWVQRYSHDQGYPEVRVGVRSQLPGNLAFGLNVHPEVAASPGQRFVALAVCRSRQ
jgi:GNAT superfamily N-acetyltransferase